MGYLIQYDPDMNHKYPQFSHMRARKIWRYVLAIAGAAALIVLSIKFREGILLWLLPGDPPVTTAAVRELIADFQNGTPVAEAVTAFCQEIIAHGAR